MAAPTIQELIDARIKEAIANLTTNDLPMGDIKTYLETAGQLDASTALLPKSVPVESLAQLPFSLALATALSPATGVVTQIPLTMTGGRLYPTHGFVANTIKVPTRGIYLINGGLAWANNATGGRWAFWTKNGATTIIQGQGFAAPAVPDLARCNFIDVAVLATNDVIGLVGFQTSGLGLAISVSVESFLSVTQLSPTIE